MSIDSLPILVVGDLLPGTGEILRRFSSAGWGWRQVRKVREARDLLLTVDPHIVLAAEVLPDGRGYDLAETAARHARTLIVGVALSETCLWLPVVYRGVNVLGRRALPPEALEAEMKDLLGMRAAAASAGVVGEIYHRTPFVPAADAAAAGGPGPQSQRTDVPGRPASFLRRRYRDKGQSLA